MAYPILISFFRRPIDKLDHGIKQPAQVNPLTGDKILQSCESFIGMGLTVIVISSIPLVYSLVGFIRGINSSDIPAVISVFFAGFIIGGWFLFLQRRRVIIIRQGLKIINLFGDSSQFDWAQVRKIDYKAWNQSMSFVIGSRNSRKAVSFYNSGIADLAQSIRENLKPEIYTSVTFIIDYIINTEDAFRKGQSEIFWREATNDLLLGGGTASRRFLRIYPIILEVAGILICAISLYGIIIKKSGDTSVLGAGLVTIALGLVIQLIKAILKKFYRLE
jgi:hypothetical protein